MLRWKAFGGTRLVTAWFGLSLLVFKGAFIEPEFQKVWKTPLYKGKLENFLVC